MPKPKHTAILIPLLLLALAVPICAQGTGIPESTSRTDYNPIWVKLAAVEVAHWGKENNIGVLSLAGTWRTDKGTILTIKPTKTGVDFREDFGHGYVEKCTAAVDNDTINFDSIPMTMKRTTNTKPEHPFVGILLSEWRRTDDHRLQYTNMPFVIFSTKGSRLYITRYIPPMKGGPVWMSGDMIRRSKDRMTFSGTSAHSLKQETPGAEPDPDAWKQLILRSAENLRTLWLITHSYTESNNGKYPDAATEDQLYVSLFGKKKTNIIYQPLSGAAYRYNSALTGKDTSAISDSYDPVLFYETKPWPDGSRCVVFAKQRYDMTNVKLLTKEEWEKLAKRDSLQ